MRLLILLTLMLLFTLPAAAQEGYPLPESLSVITPENAADLKQLASIGAALPGQLAWSPNGVTLAVGTSEETLLYNTANLDTAPISIPASKNISFNDAGELVANGQRWDITTGELLGEVAPVTPSITSPSGNIVATWNTVDGETVLSLSRPDGSVVTPLNLNGMYEVVKIVFSPDEQFMAFAAFQTIETDRGYNTVLVVQLWNISEGAFVADIPLTLEILDTLKFHADGKLLVTAVRTDAVYGGLFEDVGIWDGQTGQPIESAIRGIRSLPVRFSPDDRLMAFDSSGGTILWSDHELGLLKYPQDGSAGESAFQFSPDSLTLATTFREGVFLWDTTNLTEGLPDAPRVVLNTNTQPRDLLYTPDGSSLIIAESDNIFTIWDAETGLRKGSFRAFIDSTINQIEISPDGRWLRGIAYSRARFSNIFYVWELSTGSQKTTLPVSGAFNRDWSWAAFWDDNLVRVINISTGQVTDLAVIPDYLGNIAAFSSSTSEVLFDGQAIRGYNLRSGQQVFSQPKYNRPVRAIFSLNGQNLINVWGNSDPKFVDIWQVEHPHQLVNSLEIQNAWGEWSLSPSGKYLLLTDPSCGDGGGGYYGLWDSTTGDYLGFGGGDCDVDIGLFSADENWLLMSGRNVFRATHIPTAIAAVANGQSSYFDDTSEGIVYGWYGNVKNVTISPDDQLVAITLFTNRYEDFKPVTDHSIVLFAFSDLTSANRILAQDLTNIMTIPGAQKPRFSPDSAWLLTDIGLWNTATGQQTAEIFSTTAAFSPDNNIVATVDAEGVHLWSIADLSAGATTPLITLPAEDVQQVAFSPDGTLLYLKHAGEVSVWGIGD